MASNAHDGGSGRRIPWRIFGWGVVAILISLPLVAMQFTSEVNWTLSDFIFAAAMFGIVGGLFELTVRASGNKWYRGGVALALLTSFLLVWVNGAVGVIGDEGNPANLMFFVVILMAIAGAIAARFEARGMARAMIVAAGAQMAVAAIVLAAGLGANEPPGMAGVVIIICFFAVLWFLSAFCFRKAAAG
jgi:hypothetical protein